MKIGLYTIHASHNVGAMLQAFALTKVLEKGGAEVELVNLYPIAEELQNHHSTKGSFLHDLMRSIYLMLHPQIRTMERNFDKFHKQLPLSKRFYSSDEYIENPLRYDLHLIGSDQVWNLQKGFDFSKFYFLDYLPADAKRVSYGASFGTCDDVKSLDEVAGALRKFEKLSVREDRAVALVESLVKKECTQVLDPTLLLSSNDWDEYISNDPIVKGQYIFFYGVNSDDTTWSIIKLAKEKLGLPVVGYPGPLRPQYPFDKFILDGGPCEFVNLIKNATMVITSSFHGLAFSVNYDKPFLLINYSTRMERMESLVKLLKAQSHLVGSLADAERVLSEKHFSLANNLSVQRQKSLTWIKENILEQ